MKKPIIALNMAYDKIKALEGSYIFDNYVQAIIKAGGTPLLIPTLEDDSILDELQEDYSESINPSLIKTLTKIYAKTKEGFIFVIDEWDCVFRYYPDDKEAHKQYLDYLKGQIDVADKEIEKEELLTIRAELRK